MKGQGLLIALMLTLLFCPMILSAGTFSGSAHEDPNTGVNRTENFPIGDCSQCHSQHAGHPYTLITDYTNNLCFTCHAEAAYYYPADESDRWPGTNDDERVGFFETNSDSERTVGLIYRKRWPGQAVYTNPNTYDSNCYFSPHANDSDMLYKDANGLGLCKNCHNPHGSTNFFDMLKIPYLNTDGQADAATPSNYQLCFSCHSPTGPAVPAGMSSENKRIADFYNQTVNDDHTSGHQIRQSNHSVSLSPWPAYIQIGDKLACYNCHNPHGSRGHKNNGWPNTRLLSDQRSAWNGLTNTRQDPNQCRTFCFGCHVPSDKIPSQWGNPTVEGITMASIQPNLSVHRTSSNRGCYDCHGRDYSSSTGYNVHHPNGGSCTDCHAFGTDHSHPAHTGGNLRGVELNCEDCHGADTETGMHTGHDNGIVEFTDGNSLASTTVCNTCHSPNGDFNGVSTSGASIGAKDRWNDGVYTGDALISGQEKWCVGCHDISPAVVSTVPSPNIAGDHSIYGYYINGHRIPCDNCHDLSLTHCDGHRATYRYGFGNYRMGYRLKEIGPNPPLSLVIPRLTQTFTKDDFRLCFSCHDPNSLIGLDTSPIYLDWKSKANATFVTEMGTNFRNDNQVGTNNHGGSRLSNIWPTNSHWNHLAPPNLFNYQSPPPGGIGCYKTPGCHSTDYARYDSNLDGTVDSYSSCPTCHNPHGTKNASTQATPFMTRGDLKISHGNDLTNGPYGYIGSDAYSQSGGDLYCRQCHCKTGRFGASFRYYRTALSGPACTSATCHVQGQLTGSHQTHFDTDHLGPGLTSCSNCHDEDDAHLSVFNDGQPLSSTTVCNTCHSYGGAYDGVNDYTIGAKYNWDDGVYEDANLAQGLGNWCLGCHDDGASNISSTNAPNIAGNNSSYGYEITGHGHSLYGDLPCTQCHDQTKNHIDGNERSYTAASDNYQTAFRLKSVGGSAPLDIPLTTVYSSTAMALCYQCHEEENLVGVVTGAYLRTARSPAPREKTIGTWETFFINSSSTGYYDGDPNHIPVNIHRDHLYDCASTNSQKWDSDRDATYNSSTESYYSCPTCHNPHGTAQPQMTRTDLGVVIDPNGEFGYLSSNAFSLSGGDLYCGSCHSITGTGDGVAGSKWYRHDPPLSP